MKQSGIEVTAEFDPRTIDKKYKLEPMTMRGAPADYERFNTHENPLTPAQIERARTDWAARYGARAEATFKATMVGICIRGGLIAGGVLVALTVLKVFHVWR